jgi:hypothetical protein
MVFVWIVAIGVLDTIGAVLTPDLNGASVNKHVKMSLSAAGEAEDTLAIDAACSLCPTGTLNTDAELAQADGESLTCGEAQSLISHFGLTCGEAQAAWRAECCIGTKISAQEDRCCGEVASIIEASAIFQGGGLAFAMGDSDGPCCVLEAGVQQNLKMRLMSASKLVTSYIIMELIDQGLFEKGLETRAADVLDWWSSDPGDERAGVTLHLLLTQMDGFNTYADGLGMCRNATLVGCAWEAYHASFGNHIGVNYTYSESTFAVLGAMALSVTGHDSYNDVFKEYIAEPLGISTEDCAFEMSSIINWVDPGGSISCSLTEYSKFLAAVQGRNLVSQSLQEAADKPQTLLLNAQNMPVYGDLSLETSPEGVHYGFGQWRHCATPDCRDTEGVFVESIGYFGALPWIWRGDSGSYWAMIVPFSAPWGPLVGLSEPSPDDFNSMLVTMHSLFLADAIHESHVASMRCNGCMKWCEKKGGKKKGGKNCDSICQKKGKCVQSF